MKPTILSWSSGKDSAWALHLLRQSREHEVVGLLTTINAAADRVAMHAVRRSLLEAQARAAGLPLTTIALPWPCSNQEYENLMLDACDNMVARGVQAIAFADLFLADIREYRERLLSRHGVAGLYPIWGRDTGQLIRDFIRDGFRAVVVCVDPARLSPSFAGRIIDEGFLADLPPSVDPCGEHGEFHTFVFDGPIFRTPVKFSIGEIVCRDSFWFCDLVPENESERTGSC